MRETREKEIGGALVRTVQLPALRALKLLPRLAQLEDFNLPGDDLVKLARELLASTVVVRDGKQVQLDREENINACFADVASLWAAVNFAVEVNFAGFDKGRSPAPPEGSEPGPATPEE